MAITKQTASIEATDAAGRKVTIYQFAYFDGEPPAELGRVTMTDQGNIVIPKEPGVYLELRPWGNELLRSAQPAV